MNVKKVISLLTATISSLVALLQTCKTFQVLASDGIERVPMMMINYPLILIGLFGAGIIGSITFIMIAAADLLRRRRKKYSCIQHQTYSRKTKRKNFSPLISTPRAMDIFH